MYKLQIFLIALAGILTIISAVGTDGRCSLFSYVIMWVIALILVIEKWMRDR